MPAIVFFGRAWSFASDDFVLYGALDLLTRLICYLIMGLPFHFTQNPELCLSVSYTLVLFALIFVIGGITILLDLILSLLSARGGVMDVSKRSGVSHVLLILLVFSFLELVLHSVNIYLFSFFASDCNQTVVALFITGNALRIFIIMQYYIWLALHFRRNGVFWGQLVYNYPRAHEGFISQDTNLITRLQAHAVLSQSVQRDLEGLLKFKNSCRRFVSRHDAQEQVAVSSAATLFSDVFFDINLVASDVIVGLLLLRWQTNQWVGCGHRVPLSSVECTSMACSGPPSWIERIPRGDVIQESTEASDWLTITRLQRVTQIGISIYGRLLYCFAFCGHDVSLCGLCKLLPSVARQNRSQLRPAGSHNCCLCSERNCDYAAVLAITGLQQCDFVSVNFENTVYQSPYFVATDDVAQVIVVAVRGTLSLEDAVVDLLYDGIRVEEAEIFAMQQGLSKPTFIGHRGMVSSARRIYQCLVSEDSVNFAKHKRPDYPLVVCGHSLGAGIASFLTLLLRPLYPEVKGYALSAPLGTMNAELAEYCKPFLVSIIYGFDAFARMNKATVMDFKWRLVDALSVCKVPKFRLLTRGAELCLWRCGYKSCSTCCCPFLRPLTVGRDTKLLDAHTQHRLIHPSPDYLGSVAPNSHPMGDDQTTGWPSRLHPGNRSLLRWMNGNEKSLFYAAPLVNPENVSPHSVSDAESPAIEPLSYEMRNGVFGGLVMHVVDVDMEGRAKSEPSSVGSHENRSTCSTSDTAFLPPHLVHEVDCCRLSKSPSKTTVAVWTTSQQFQTLLIHPRMFMDHMPDNFLRAINRLYLSSLGGNNFYRSDLQPSDVFRRLI